MSKKIIFISSIISLFCLFLILDLVIYKGQFSGNITLIKMFRMPKIFVLTLGTIGATFSTYMIHILTKNTVAGIGTLGINSINLLLFTILYGILPTTLYIWIDKYIMWSVYICGSLLILGVIFVLTKKYNKSMNKIILVGIILSMLISSITFMYISQMPQGKQDHVIQLSVGSIKNTAYIYNQPSTYATEACLLVAVSLYALFYRKIKLVSFDDIHAKALGINISRIRFIIMIIIGLTAAASFMMIGATAFIGFIATNIVYNFYRRQSFVQLLMSILVALTLMYIVYFINSSWMSWNLSIGIVSNIVALPYLVIVLTKKTNFKE